jgi:hypothetical protein
MAEQKGSVTTTVYKVSLNSNALEIPARYEGMIKN